MIWVAAALAGPMPIVATEPLRPGRTAIVEVHVPVQGQSPELTVEGGVTRGGEWVRSRIWAFGVQPLPGVEQVLVRADVQGATDAAALAVEPPPTSALVLPRSTDSPVRAKTVSFVVTGPVPEPEGLGVYLSEGKLLEIRTHEEGLEVVVAPAESPFPRVIALGVRDLSRDEEPAWGRVRLWARPRIPLDAEPGSSLVLTVGSREYGPFDADDSGSIVAFVEQYPGENLARALFSDELGNQTVADLPLAGSQDGALVLAPSGPLALGWPSPLVYVHHMDEFGAPSSSPPACKTPSVDLHPTELGRGRWSVATPAARDGELDVRLECSTSKTSSTLRLKGAANMASSLKLRVWPKELRSDFPVAEIRAVVEDWRGDRLSPAGLELAAAHGQIEATADGSALVGDYVGEAGFVGVDDIVASWRSPTGNAPLQRVDWGVEQQAEHVIVHGRALDLQGRPLEGVELTLALGGEERTSITGSTGWATESFAKPPSAAIARVASSQGWWTQHIVPSASAVSIGGPDRPDLQEEAALTVRPGRVAGISLEVEPSVLRAAPGAVAYVIIRLEDGAGQPITDEEVNVTPSEGSLGPLRLRSDGSFVAEYQPGAQGESREVTLTAQTSSVRSTTRLRVEPRVVRASFGPWVGYHANFGIIGSPTFGLDLDLRVRNKLFGERIMLRLGAFAYSFGHDVPEEEAVRSDSTLVPITAAFLYREDRGPLGLWFGGGGAVGIQSIEGRYADGSMVQFTKTLGGPAAFVGASTRLLGGEAVLELRSIWLASSPGDLGYTGNVGGFSTGLGYRLVY